MSNRHTTGAWHETLLFYRAIPFRRPDRGCIFALATIGETKIRADDPPAATATVARSFVGHVANAVDTARVGIVADDTSYILYLCSQDEAFNKSSARWAKGSVANGKFEGKSPDGAMIVKGMVGIEKVDGSIAFGGKEMTFSAKLSDERTYAGLYRAEEKEATTDYVAGWVVDEDDQVAGAVQNRQNRQITNPPGVAGQQKPVPKGNIVSPRGGNRAPDLTTGQGTGVGGQQVTDPKNPATGAGKKFSAADFQNQVLQISANLEKKGGSPLFALTIHQVRRFLSGAKPSNSLETKTFARLARIPKGTLTDYVKNWDALPATTRQRILGPKSSQLDNGTPLTPQFAKNFLGIREAVPTAAANSPTVSSVRLTQFQCINPVDVRKDEVFYTCLVASGTTAFSNISDTYKGIKKGDLKNFKARDSQFWPKFNTTNATTSEIVIGVGLYDDDSGIRGAVVNLFNGLGDVAGDIAAESGVIGSAIMTGFQEMFEATAAVISSVRFIGSDAILVKPNKQTVGANGAAKSELRFTRSGVNDVDYRFKGFLVN